MQAVNRSEQCSVRGPSTEREAQPLIRPLGRGSSDPQTHPQTRNTGRLHLEAHPVAPLAQPMPAAQYTFHPAEQQFNGIITNDKFCCTRWSQLQLSRWRRPLRLRS